MKIGGAFIISNETQVKSLAPTEQSQITYADEGEIDLHNSTNIRCFAVASTHSKYYLYVCMYVQTVLHGEHYLTNLMLKPLCRGWICEQFQFNAIRV